MLSAWETVWVCVGLTMAVMILDAWLAARSAQSRGAVSEQDKQTRQRNMVYKDVEGDKQ